MNYKNPQTPMEDFTEYHTGPGFQTALEQL